MVNSEAVANLIRKGKTFQLPSIIATSREQGMQSMDSELRRLVNGGRISAEEAYLKARDKKDFEPLIAVAPLAVPLAVPLAAPLLSGGQAAARPLPAVIFLGEGAAPTCPGVEAHGSEAPPRAKPLEAEAAPGPSTTLFNHDGQPNWAAACPAFQIAPATPRPQTTPPPVLNRRSA
jgi:hypothetical protein